MKVFHNYFIERGQNVYFYPWYGMMVLGAIWVVKFPADFNRRLLEQIVALFSVAIIAGPIVAVICAHVLGYDPKALFFSSWIVLFALYSCTTAVLVRKCERVPFNTGIRVLARRLGRDRLWQFIIIGGVCLSASVLVGLNDKVINVMLALLATNTLLGIYALRYTHHISPIANRESRQ